MRFINGYDHLTSYFIISPYLNCVQSILFVPYLCHTNSLALIMFNKSNKKETMKTDTQKTTQQYQKNMQSNAKIDDLYRKIENNENQWFALDFILDHLNENQKVKIRRYIKDLIKEEKNIATI